MNNYHLYEEIGHGKCSSVYKGRKRHTIRYVAVKSIEKNRRDKVMAEVSILQKLNHVNIVGFFSWHETRNHLWIIFEYCAGGDLLRILKQDGRLPEDQVRRFGRDVCAGLLHLHSHSVIYSDLKPANLLSNEDGRLKLSEFGNAQRLQEIERAIEDHEVLPRRGSPHYMAPELFQDGGMHSFASDLWALGCVLCEMFAGRPPFHAASFEKLQKLVLEESAPCCSDASPEFQSVVGMLLNKCPFDRPNWVTVRNQDFWRGKAPGDAEDADSLPPQPHLEELRRWWGVSMSLSLGAQRGSTYQSTNTQPEVHEVETQVLHADSNHSERPLSLDTIASNTAWGATPAADTEILGGDTAHGETKPGLEQPRLDAQHGVGSLSHGPTVIGAAPGGGGARAAPMGELVNGQRCLRLRLGSALHAHLREVVSLVDTAVRPISRNPQIEQPESLDVLPDNLPFTRLNFEEVGSLPDSEIEDFLTRVYTCIAQGPLEQKLGTLQYLEQVCCHMQMVDIIVNSSLLRLVLRMLHAHRTVGSGGPAVGVAATGLRTRLLSFIGQLLRHATYLEPGVADMGIFEALLDGSQSGNDDAVRRRSTAALGELLFYVATQPACYSSMWNVPGDVLRVLVEIPGAQTDEVVQHYAVKTIENIATMCPEMAHTWFFSMDLLHSLSQCIARSSSDPFRLSCLATIGHLLRGTSTQELLGATLAQLDPASVLVGLTDLAPQGISHTIHILSQLVLCDAGAEAVQAWFSLDLLDHVCGVLSQARFPGALRSRTLVLVVLLVALDDPGEAQTLHLALGRSFVKEADRLAREKDPLVGQSLTAAVAVMEAVVFSIMQSLVGRLRQITSSVDDVGANELAQLVVQVLPIFLHLVSSVALCGCVINSRALPVLGSACEITTQLTYPPVIEGAYSYDSAIHQLQPFIINVIETLGSQQALLLEHSIQVVRCLLPALTTCFSSLRCDVRLHSLKAFSGICILFLSDRHISDSAAETPSETLMFLEALICSRALPALPSLLLDEPPAPAYAMRLLAALLPRESTAVKSVVAELKLVQPLLVALSKEQGLTLHSALLVQSLLQGHEVRIRDVRDAGVLDAVQATLSEAAEAAVGHLGQMDLALLDSALCIAQEVLLQCKASYQVMGGRAHGRGGRDRQHLDVQAGLVDIGPLVRAAPALAVLAAPMAHARLLPLLDRLAACLHHLANLARVWSQEWGKVGVQPSTRGLGSMLEALAVLCRWRPEGGTASLACNLLSTLTWALAICSSADVKGELAAGVEKLLRDRLLGEDANVLAEARNLISTAKTPVVNAGPTGTCGAVLHVT